MLIESESVKYGIVTDDITPFLIARLIFCVSYEKNGLHGLINSESRFIYRVDIRDK